MPPLDPAQLASQLAASRKYAHLCPDTLLRIAQWATVRYPKEDEALKAAKRKLHQVFASYLPVDPGKWDKWMQEVAWQDAEQVRAFCRRVLASHASSAERLEFVEELYRQLWERTGPPGSVLDLACGMNPLALPWMHLPSHTAYYATDIDRRMTDVANTLLGKLGRAGEVFCRDLLADNRRAALPDADVVMLLKAVPCLEQQEKGISQRIFQEIAAPWLIVSFPAQSLGGKDKGMVENYRQVIHTLADSLGRTCEEMRFPTETFYLLAKPALRG